MIKTVKELNQIHKEIIDYIATLDQEARVRYFLNESICRANSTGYTTVYFSFPEDYYKENIRKTIVELKNLGYSIPLTMWDRLLDELLE